MQLKFWLCIQESTLVELANHKAVNHWHLRSLLKRRPQLRSICCDSNNAKLPLPNHTSNLLHTEFWSVLKPSVCLLAGIHSKSTLERRFEPKCFSWPCGDRSKANTHTAHTHKVYYSTPSSATISRRKPTFYTFYIALQVLWPTIRWGIPGISPSRKCVWWRPWRWHLFFQSRQTSARHDFLPELEHQGSRLYASHPHGCSTRLAGATTQQAALKAQGGCRALGLSHGFMP